MATALKEPRGTLPYFPPKDDPDQRVRMGCPVAGENLRYRYREVAGGASPASWTDKDFLVGSRFEWSLADLGACVACEGKCRTVTGCKQYMDLDRRGMEGRRRAAEEKVRELRQEGQSEAVLQKILAEASKPLFRIFACHDLTARKAAISGRVVTYR